MSECLSRRKVLIGLVGAGAATTLAACSRSASPAAADASQLAPLVDKFESARPTTGQVRKLTLTAAPTQVDLAGTVVTTWAYNGSVPGPPLRATAGDRVQVEFQNGLPEATSVHWHGLAIRNDMDGVPGVTTPEIGAGASFGYDFIVPDAGTHWFHPHHGMQLDRGLYAPFIVDDPAESGDYDLEWVVVLDDWTDGVGQSPQEIYDGLLAAGKSGGGMGGMDMGGMDAGSGMSGMDGGDVQYPLYLVNGRAPADPEVLAGKPGQKVRLRVINASADTIFDVALDGHDLRVTHSDGYRVNEVPASLLRLGMGERYDVTVTLKDGVFPFVAQPLGKAGLARALVRTATGAVPAVTYRPRAARRLPVDSGRCDRGAR